MNKVKKKIASKKGIVITRLEKSLWSDASLENRRSVFNFKFKTGELTRLGKIVEPKDNSSEEKKYKGSFSEEFFSKIIK